MIFEHPANLEAKIQKAEKTAFVKQYDTSFLSINSTKLILASSFSTYKNYNNLPLNIAKAIEK